jgi:hypothetical protein
MKHRLVRAERDGLAKIGERALEPAVRLGHSRGEKGLACLDDGILRRGHGGREPRENRQKQRPALHRSNI